MPTRWAVLSLLTAAFLVAQLPGDGPKPRETPKKPVARADDDDPFAGMDDAKPSKKPARKAAEDDPFGGMDDARPVKKPAEQPAAEGKPAAEKRRDKPASPRKPRGTIRPAASNSSLSPSEAIRLALEKQVKLKSAVGCTSPGEVCEELKGVLGIPILLDVKPLEDIGVCESGAFFLSLDRMSARSALDSLLLTIGEDDDLAWTISNEVLLITTRERADSILETVVYDVHDLVASREENGRTVHDFRQLLDALRYSVARWSWSGAGRSGGPGVVMPFEGKGIAAIGVFQTPQNHEKIAQLLADLRKARRSKAGRPANPSPESQNAGNRSQKPEVPKGVQGTGRVSTSGSVELIRRALEKQVEVDFDQLPLVEVVECLRDYLKVPVVVQQKALNEVGVSPEFSLQVRGISVRAALNLMLSQVDLTWTVSNDVLLITTPEKAESMEVTVVYDVHDLVAEPGEKGQGGSDFDQLIDLITATIRPTSWDAGTGPGPVSPVACDGVAAICVRQAWPIQEEIAKLLADLRKARSLKPGEKPVEH